VDTGGGSDQDFTARKPVKTTFSNSSKFMSLST